MQLARRKHSHYLIMASTFVLTLLASAPLSAQEPLSARNDTLRRVIHEFVGLSGYWFTNDSAVQALGTPKFGGDTTIYVRPAHRHHLLITGGIEIAGATDHWLPFSGGNSFSLTGASFRVSGERRLGRPNPYFSGGLFAGNVHSEQQNFDTTRFVPSMALGAEMQVHRYVTLSASYRVSGNIGDVNTDGFRLSLKFF